MAFAAPASPAQSFARRVLDAPRRLALPVAVYPGLHLVPGTVHALVSDAEVQARIQLALQARYRGPFVLTAMDLSLEAEAFGATVRWVDSEIPTVVGRLVCDEGAADRLRVPEPGEARTGVPIAAARHLAAAVPDCCVVGGCIGPFSLAARLAGVAEALELTVDSPGLLHLLLRKATDFLAAQAVAFQTAGAHALLIAEPSAGLLSPRAMAIFSSAYLRELRDRLSSLPISLILHNCSARLPHLPALLETGFEAFHFGAAMDLPAALGRVPAGTVLCGNLDPAAQFCSDSPEQMKSAVTALLEATAAHRNFVLSSGCDLPPDTRLSALDAFHEALENWNSGR